VTQRNQCEPRFLCALIVHCFQLGIVAALIIALGPLTSAQEVPWQKSLRKARTTLQESTLPIGFDVADLDDDQSLTRTELRKYLKPRLKGMQLPFGRIFSDLDLNHDSKITEAEFEPRNEVIQKYVQELYAPVEIVPDPGPGYKLFNGIDQPQDDSLIYSAVYHRTLEATATTADKPIDLTSIPRSAPNSFRRISSPSGLERACNATVVLAGGQSDEDFFTGGGVIISPDGLLVTNYHIVESINDGLIAMLADGRVVKVEKILAANPDADVALVKLSGQNFPYVPVAPSKPSMAADIVMVHHSESRFYTYDRGFVKRYPIVQGLPWMEVSMPFAPGGSGCGIFNDRYELVGVVCFISVGDGPSMAAEPAEHDKEKDGDKEDIPKIEEPAYLEMSSLVVRLAVPLQAIEALWGQK
jgi:Trypsin-like peptidase domain